MKGFFATALMLALVLTAFYTYRLLAVGVSRDNE